jgi:hypothetical protein
MIPEEKQNFQKKFQKTVPDAVRLGSDAVRSDLTDFSC